MRKRYATARTNAAAETDLALRTLPGRCPYSAEQVLDSNYFPETMADE
jgi:hypothetical protein